MKTGDLLFVYGTLRKGASADLAKGSASFDVTFIDTDRINGELYNIGWFPGVKNVPDVSSDTPYDFDPSSPTVVGDVFLIRDDSVRAVLDAYEGYPNLYNRWKTMTEEGRCVWVYTYNDDPDPSSRIESGDWMDSPRMKVVIGVQG